MAYNSCDELELSWCIISSFLLALSTILLILTVIKKKVILYIILYHRSQINIINRNLVFFCQFSQILAMILHYILVGPEYNIIFLIQEYLLLVQFSLVFYYFIAQLAQNMFFIKKFKTPLFIMNILMLLGFIIYYLVNHILNRPIYNCNNGIWVYLHSCGMILSIIFIIIGYRSTKTITEMKNISNVIVDNRKLKHFW